MDRKTRICIAIIVLGLANFLVYAVVYVSVGGDAMNGYVRLDKRADPPRPRHFLVEKGRPTEVSRGVWIYSAVHSVSIWITVGAVLLAMLTLAKERIVSSMRASIIRGRTVITMLATIVTMISLLVTVWFLIHLISQLSRPAALGPAPVAPP